MTMASLLMGIRFLDLRLVGGKTKNIKEIAMILAFSLTVIIQLFCEFNDRYEIVFWDEAGGIANQTIRAETGPEKGVWMNPDIYEFYTITESDLKSIRDDSTVDKVLFLSKNTWLYLSAEKENASYSAWLSGVNDHTLYRLEQYYQMFPEKTPEIVFFDRDYVSYIPRFEALGYQNSNEETSEYAYIMKKTSGIVE